MNVFRSSYESRWYSQAMEQVEKSTLTMSEREEGYVLIAHGASRTTSTPIPRSGSIIIGRSEECDLALDDESVSRRHAAIHFGAVTVVEDLGSRNGTFVAGRRLERGDRAEFGVGSVLEIGRIVVLMQKQAQPQSSEMY